MERALHWDEIYRSRGADQVSWFEEDPVTSLSLVRRALDEGARSVIDVGGGASTLVDRLLDEGLQRLAVLDVSGAALELARQRLGGRANRVEWIAEDVTAIADVGTFDVWHDRAVFHFLTDAEQRNRYMSLAERTVPSGGHLIIATFAPDGPERCSGLDVCRYDADRLALEAGSGFTLLDTVAKLHVTPRGVSQSFIYAMFRRRVATRLAGTGGPGADASNSA